MTQGETIMEIRNLTTGETQLAHRVGTDEDGRNLYASDPNWEPTGPYHCDEDGNWMEGEGEADED